MLVIDFQSKSYHRFLHDLPQISKHKTRCLITLNGPSGVDFSQAVEDVSTYTQDNAQSSTAIIEKNSADIVSTLFTQARQTRDFLLFTNSDVLFAKTTALKNSHGRDDGFDLNNLFKNIAQHNGIVLLATDKKQTLSASMSTKVDVLIRFPVAQ